MDDVVDGIHEKMVRRHPHVYGSERAPSTHEINTKWEEIKRREKGNEDRKSVLEGVPRNLPSLIRARHLQERAAKVGFDWKHLNETLQKLDEEIDEFKESLKKENAVKIEEELGDLFFMLVNISRFLGVDPDTALRKTISKFIHRFRHIEEQAAGAGRSLSDMSLDEMESLWQESKNR
jgi:tetrapyrrole methylase family protein/MazG family protein